MYGSAHLSIASALQRIEQGTTAGTDRDRDVLHCLSRIQNGLISQQADEAAHAADQPGPVYAEEHSFGSILAALGSCLESSEAQGD